MRVGPLYQGMLGDCALMLSSLYAEMGMNVTCSGILNPIPLNSLVSSSLTSLNFASL